MPKLTDHETTTFLAEPGHLLRVATIDPDGMPRNVPIWYIIDGGRIVFTPRVHSVFLANLLRDPRVGLTIDEDALPYRKVTVQGTAEVLYAPGADDEWREPSGVLRWVLERIFQCQSRLVSHRSSKISASGWCSLSAGLTSHARLRALVSLPR
jgi:PPOX class probable F420-dependent enzyme